ncbi:unnamed protein product [Lymnaea stagnalis]|uniref:Rho-GAP domain-containing protein n=1 Tax=Lymnaea stagnalis TaxID=6523 RepID=A0AAV2IH69_LYMST
MLLLAHNRTQLASVRHLVTATVRLNREFVSYRLHKNWQHGHTKKYQGNFATLIQSGVRKGWGGLQVINPISSTNSGLLAKIIEDENIAQTGIKQVGKGAPSWIRSPANSYKGHVLDTLFGTKRRDVLASLQKSLGLLSPRCSWYLGGLRHRHTSTIPDELPNYDIPKSPIGITYAMDLSHHDQMVLTRLAYEDLKKFLKKRKIDYKSVSKKERVKDSGYLRGTDLDVLADRDVLSKKITPDCKVPGIFRTLLHYVFDKGMTSEHIFKKPGIESGIMELIGNMEANLYQQDGYSINESQSSVYDAATALKRLFQELPLRLVAIDKIHEFPDMNSLPFDDQQIVGMNLFILSMSQAHRDTLMMLLTVLKKMVDNMAATKMDATSFGDALAPDLFKVPKKMKRIEEQGYLKDMAKILKVLITYGPKLFVVTPDLLAKLRIKMDNTVPLLTAVPMSRIIVKAPFMKEEGLTIPINSSTTASDVMKTYTAICDEAPFDSSMDDLEEKVSWFEPQPYSVSELFAKEPKGQVFLFEKGGNIAERCLANNALIADVLMVNPKGTFVIKPKPGKFITQK